jgi:hypothetical protein
MADSITYLVSTKFQELLLLPITRPKIPALYCKYKKTMNYPKKNAPPLRKHTIETKAMLSERSPKRWLCVCIS